MDTNSQKKSWFLWVVSLGALIGGSLTAWLAPSVIAWWFKPPANTGFDCSLPIEWALKRLQIVQLVGVVFGAMVGLVLYLKFKKPNTEVTYAEPSQM